MSVTMNGRPQRKQLNDQLDRMDTLIDGLADALPEAVADACREGARQAVKEAVTELLLNPDVRAQLAKLIVTVPPTPSPAAERTDAEPETSLWRRLTSKLSDLKQKLQERLRVPVTLGKSRVVTALNAGTRAVKIMQALVPLKHMALVSLSLGLVVGFLVFCCPHAVSSVLVGLTASVMSFTYQVRNWFRRLSC